MKPDCITDSQQFQSCRDLCQLCEVLQYTNLLLCPSNRLKSSWHVIIHRFSGKRELHFPSILETAPEEIKIALLKWATTSRPSGRKRNTTCREKRTSFESTIRAYLDYHHTRRKRITRKNFTSSDKQGLCYNLKEVFTTLNCRFFNSELSALLRWGSVASKTSYQKTSRDPDGVLWNSITIAGIYNHSDVPRFAIESIMYHEMLHIHIPPLRCNGRRVVHGKDFHRLERAFPHYKIWRDWEKKCVSAILRDLKKKNRI